MYELFKGEEADAPEDTLVLLEWWADAAALEAHLKSPHIQQEREQNSVQICFRIQYTAFRSGHMGHGFVLSR